MILTKNSVKSQIKNQVPWFYHQEYPIFIKFLEYYYEWVENFSENNQFGYQAILDNLLQFKDIDETLEEIIPFFKQVYFRLLPEKTFVPTKLFAKQIIDLYRSKGSLQSIELLIYIIIGKPVELFLPKTLLARSSDSNFGNEYFIICSEIPTSIFSIFEMNKKYISIDGQDIFVNNIVKHYNYFKVFLDLEKFKKFNSNQIYYNNSLVARCFPLLSKLLVKESKAIFKVEDKIELYSLTPSEIYKPAKFIVSEISKGIIDSYEIKNAGYGYVKGDTFFNTDINFLAEVFKVSEIGEVLEITFKSPCNIIEKIPKINSFSKKGKFLEVLWKSSGLGKIENIIILEPGLNLLDNLKFSNNNLKCEYEISYVGINQRYYTTINNLGQYNILPDNFYYQKFSYVLDIEINENTFSKDVVRELVHPSGFLDFYKTTLFNNSSSRDVISLLSLNFEEHYFKEILEIFNNYDIIKFHELIKYANEEIFQNFKIFDIAKIIEIYYQASGIKFTSDDIMKFYDLLKISNADPFLNFKNFTDSKNNALYNLASGIEFSFEDYMKFYELLKFSNEDPFLNFKDFKTSKINELYYLSSGINISLEDITSLEDFINIDDQIIKLSRILKLLD